jgi:hypothetical protein
MMFIKVNESHQRIDFICGDPKCDSGQKRSTERVTAKMVRSYQALLTSIIFSIVLLSSLIN